MDFLGNFIWGKIIIDALQYTERVAEDNRFECEYFLYDVKIM